MPPKKPADTKPGGAASKAGATGGKTEVKKKAKAEAKPDKTVLVTDEKPGESNSEYTKTETITKTETTIKTTTVNPSIDSAVHSRQDSTPKKSGGARKKSAGSKEGAPAEEKLQNALSADPTNMEPTSTNVPRDFVNEPFGQLPVEKLPGIGPDNGRKLRKYGNKKVYQVGSIYIEHGEFEFINLMNEEYGINRKLAKRCCDALAEWIDKYEKEEEEEES